MALRVGAIGFLPRNFSDRLFIFYPRVDMGRRSLPKSTEKNAGPTISRLKPIRARLFCSADVVQQILACRGSLIEWKG
jgi:hypothetical protein